MKGKIKKCWLPVGSSPLKVRTKGIGNYMEAAAPKNEAHQKWRENWLHELSKSRVVDAELNKIDRKRQSFHK